MPRSIASVIEGRALYTLASTATAREAAQYLVQKGVGAVAVVDQGTLKGVISERDLVTRVIAAGGNPDTMRIVEIMTPNPTTIAASESLTRALAQMRERGFRHLPVVDQDRLVGMISVRDLFAAIKVELEHDLNERETMIFGSAGAL